MEGLSPQQTAFAAYYFDPKSDTFSNALQSALKAGYSEKTSLNITSDMPKWFSELLGKRKRMLQKAEARLEKSIDSKNEVEANKVSMFIAKTIGKENYSDRTEHTGKNGESLSISIVNYADNNSLSIHSEDIPDTDI